MKIKNVQIESLFHFLHELNDLTARQSRFRTRFNKIIGEHYQKNFIVERTDLINHFAEKDDSGQPINDNGKLTISLDKINEFNIEAENLDNEILLIEPNEVNKEMLFAIYNILTSDDVKIPSEFAIVHDEICEELERVIEIYNNETVK